MRAYERLLKYVKVHTTSNPNSTSHPSTKIQKDLGKIMVEELKELGIKDSFMDEHCYVYGSLEATDKHLPTIGLIAHLDTSFDASGENVRPKIIPNYDGKDVILNKEENIILKVSDYPELAKRKGETLICTDGLTLLGADDKAGIAEIMTALEVIINEKIPHGKIMICFTPDEEIGEGTTCFNYDLFKCDYAFTIDGGIEGSINYENFNAASCLVTINGINIHPGSAKGHMVNSIELAYEFYNLLPPFAKPEFTEKYEGFNHLNDINGNVEKTTLGFIIRNHNMDLFNKQKEDFYLIRDFMNKKYGEGTVIIDIKDSYFNMYEILKDHMEIIDLVIDATKEAGLVPLIAPIRGGTDGARLTYEGIICPNLGTGGANFHGRFEYITAEAMDRCVEVILNIIKKAK
ncbi:MAG: peptidase T [Bacilli bacterium]|nr:peptidase T [Bacilli bacterium]